LISVTRIRVVFIGGVFLAAAVLVSTIPAGAQGNSQEIESGDSSQTFTVTGGGDNSNQCAGIQGVSNTGNAVDKTSILQVLSEGDIEVDDSGNFTISPTSTTTCDQQVNQAATASG
jgi:hypothetical protein